MLSSLVFVGTGGHPVACSSMQQHLVASGSIQQHLVASGSIQQHMVASSSIQYHLVAYSGIWQHLVASSSIWQHLVVSGSIWQYLVASSSICQHLEQHLKTQQVFLTSTCSSSEETLGLEYELAVDNWYFDYIMIIRQYYIHIILSNIRTRDWPILKSLYLYIYIYYQLLYNGGDLIIKFYFCS